MKFSFALFFGLAAFVLSERVAVESSVMEFNDNDEDYEIQTFDDAQDETFMVIS